jgi:putative glutamine amidotransferase
VAVEGVADDGTIEAIRIDAPAFALGVQWHAEYDPQKNPVNRTLFQAFGAALTARRRAAQSRPAAGAPSLAPLAP